MPHKCHRPRRPLRKRSTFRRSQRGMPGHAISPLAGAAITARAALHAIPGLSLGATQVLLGLGGSVLAPFRFSGRGR